jgi:DNA-binding IclR family transcriptional regulator
MRDGQLFQYLEDFFAKAEVPDRYAHYDVLAAKNRLLHRWATPQALAALRAGGRCESVEYAVMPHRMEWIDPGQDHLVDAEDAWRDLNAVSLLVVHSPDAAAQLSRLVDTGPVDGHGTLVFACLLYLTGHHEGARFWWEFAAGADSAPATYCLVLDHARQGEYHDAEVWADRLARSGFAPEHVWGERADAPADAALPPTLLASVTESDHEALGRIPVPGRRLLAAVRGLALLASAAALDARPLPPVPLRLPAVPLKDRVWAPAPLGPRPLAAAVRRQPAVEPRYSELAVRHPGVTAAVRQAATFSQQSDALRKARLALDVVKVLERHRLGVGIGRIVQESAVPAAQLSPIMAMLCEEEFAQSLTGEIYAPGPAMDRLAAHDGPARQLQRTLDLARDSIHAAIYLCRYIDGEVSITQVADGPLTPRVHEWVDFRAAAHASAVGKCLLAQLDQDRRAEHLARHKPVRLTRRTITSSQALFHALDRFGPEEPLFDLCEYSPRAVCGAVPLSIGSEIGSLGLSLPVTGADRLKAATHALAGKAVPILLTLLLAGELPPGGPRQDDSPLRDAQNSVMTTDDLNRLRRLFRTPLITANAVRRASYSATPEPHLVSDTNGAVLYLFDAPASVSATDHPPLSLPRTYADPDALCEPLTAPEHLWSERVRGHELLVFST